MYFTDTQQWNGFAWCEVGCTHGYTTPLDEEPYFRPSRFTAGVSYGGDSMYPNRDRGSNFAGD